MRIYIILTICILAFVGMSSALELPAAEGQNTADTAAQQPDYKERLNEIISVNFKDIDLKEAVALLAEEYNLNILTTDEVKGAVTINLKDVPLRDVLTQILKLKNFTYKWEGNIIKVVSAEEEVETRVFSVNHIALDTASEVLADKISKDGKVKMNTATNQLIVTDTMSKLDTIQTTLQDIDIPPAQVRIESKLVDISHSDLDNLGITWTTTALEIKPFPKQLFGKDLWRAGEGAKRPKLTQFDLTNAGTSSNLTGGQVKLGISQGSSSVAATIDALIRRKKARIIANPSITTVNNAEARINIGEKYPIKEQTQTSTGTLQTVRFVDIGTTLKVTPKINNDGTVQLTIHPEVSSVASTITDGPRITTREADTTVIVKDGETLVIAGLLSESDEVNKSEVPILGSIPLLNILFQSRDKYKQQKELVIFMTPFILNRADKGSYESKKAVGSEVDLTAKRIGAIELFDKADDLEKGRSLQMRIFPVESRLFEAARTYERIAGVFPDSYYADVGLYRAGYLYENKLRDYPSAISCYQKLLQGYPNSAYFGYAKNHLKKLIAKDIGKKTEPDTEPPDRRRSLANPLW